MWRVEAILVLNICYWCWPLPLPSQELFSRAITPGRVWKKQNAIISTPVLQCTRILKPATSAKIQFLTSASHMTKEDLEPEDRFWALIKLTGGFPPKQIFKLCLRIPEKVFASRGNAPEDSRRWGRAAGGGQRWSGRGKCFKYTALAAVWEVDRGREWKPEAGAKSKLERGWPGPGLGRRSRRACRGLDMAGGKEKS